MDGRISRLLRRPRLRRDRTEQPLRREDLPASRAWEGGETQPSREDGEQITFESFMLARSLGRRGAARGGLHGRFGRLLDGTIETSHQQKSPRTTTVATLVDGAQEGKPPNNKRRARRNGKKEARERLASPPSLGRKCSDPRPPQPAEPGMVLRSRAVVLGANQEDQTHSTVRDTQEDDEGLPRVSKQTGNFFLDRDGVERLWGGERERESLVIGGHPRLSSHVAS